MRNRVKQSNFICDKCGKEISPLGKASHIRNCAGKRFCLNCNGDITHKRNDKKFCSLKCSNENYKGLSKDVQFSEEHREKISKAKKGKMFSNEHKGTLSQKLKSFHKEKRKLIDIESTKHKINLDNYRTLCRFRFNLADFPEEFEFELIKKYGWYSPKNKKNNLGGISRDHLVSVAYGFENNIHPDIICHPANCKLIRQVDNSSKHSKCSISLKELEQRIKMWEKNYGAQV